MTRVLLVEDSPHDVRFVREALSESGKVEVPVVILSSSRAPEDSLERFWFETATLPG